MDLYYFHCRCIIICYILCVHNYYYCLTMSSWWAQHRYEMRWKPTKKRKKNPFPYMQMAIIGSKNEEETRVVHIVRCRHRSVPFFFFFFNPFSLLFYLHILTASRPQAPALNCMQDSWNYVNYQNTGRSFIHFGFTCGEVKNQWPDR